MLIEGSGSGFGFKPLTGGSGWPKNIVDPVDPDPDPQHYQNPFGKKKTMVRMASLKQILALK